LDGFVKTAGENTKGFNHRGTEDTEKSKKKNEKVSPRMKNQMNTDKTINRIGN